MLEEHAKIWFGKRKFYKALENVDFYNKKCRNIYCHVSFPATSAVYISSNKTQWVNAEDAFVSFITKYSLLQAGVIRPDEEFSYKYISNDGQWINDIIDFMEEVYCGSKIVRWVEPHKISTERVVAETIQWFKLNHSVEHEIAVIIAELQNSSFISVYPDSYTYDKLFFGETDKKFILVSLQLIE